MSNDDMLELSQAELQRLRQLYKKRRNHPGAEVDREIMKLKYNSLSNSAKQLLKFSWVLLIFSIVCFITMFILNNSVNQNLVKNLPVKGGILGPINVKKDHSVYSIIIQQPLNSFDVWSFVNGSVLDKNKEFLFGFGKELWSEEGYDDGGHWTEQENNYEIKVTFPTKGTYYLEFESENNSSNVGEITVQVSQKIASSLIFDDLGAISLVIAVIILLIILNKIDVEDD